LLKKANLAITECKSLQKNPSLLGLLSEWRVRGVTGRKNEWLCGVSAEKVRRIAISALVESGLPFQSINE